MMMIRKEVDETKQREREKLVIVERKCRSPEASRGTGGDMGKGSKAVLMLNGSSSSRRSLRLLLAKER